MSIMFTERLDAEKRKNGWRSSGKRLGGMPLRKVPPDFVEVAKKYWFRTVRLVEHYAATDRIIRRWAAETGVELLSHNESVRMSKPKPEFDPTADGALLRQAIAALTLTSRHHPQ
jgi:hypothetical protein